MPLKSVTFKKLKLKSSQSGDQNVTMLYWLKLGYQFARDRKNVLVPKRAASVQHYPTSGGDLYGLAG